LGGLHGSLHAVGECLLGLYALGPHLQNELLDERVRREYTREGDALLLKELMMNDFCQ